MHLFLAFVSIVAAFSGIATAATLPESPAPHLLARQFTPQPDDPNKYPVDVKNLHDGDTMTCGSTTFDYSEIYAAVQWGTILQVADLSRGVPTSETPGIRGLPFPNSYTNMLINFEESCLIDSYHMQYPLIKKGPYNGSSRDSEFGDHRVIYRNNKRDEAQDANPIVHFCGGITHEGVEEEGEFVECTVNKGKSRVDRNGAWFWIMANKVDGD